MDRRASEDSSSISVVCILHCLDFDPSRRHELINSLIYVNGLDVKHLVVSDSEDIYGLLSRNLEYKGESIRRDTNDLAFFFR